MIRKLEELVLDQKNVFLRVDFNVPVENGRVTEPHRIESALPTIRFILERARKVLIASHLGRPNGKVVPQYSLAPVRDCLEGLLGEQVALAPDCIGPAVERLTRDATPRVVLLENLRFHKGEEENDPAFARALASLAEVYVNDAFGAAHRAHASIVGIAAHFKEKGAGLLLQKELDYLTRLLAAPERPFVTILGGAKVSDKIGVIRNLLPRVDQLLIGGAMAYTFLAAQGVEVGKSRVEKDKLTLAGELMAEAERKGIRLLLPVDHVTGDENRGDPRVTAPDIPADRIGLDVGPKTIEQFGAAVRQARMVLWNGPLGLFESEPFSHGSRAIARLLAESHDRLVSVVAGGDTVAAVNLAGVEDRITHLSTGGGATLEFLEGRELPGIKALETNA